MILVDPFQLIIYHNSSITLVMIYKPSDQIYRSVFTLILEMILS